MPVGIHIHAELENQELEQTKYGGSYLGCLGNWPLNITYISHLQRTVCLCICLCISWPLNVTHINDLQRAVCLCLRLCLRINWPFILPHINYLQRAVCYRFFFSTVSGNTGNTVQKNWWVLFWTAQCLLDWRFSSIFWVLSRTHFAEEH